MKKLIALVLVLVVLGAGSAGASDWVVALYAIQDSSTDGVGHLSWMATSFEDMHGVGVYAQEFENQASGKVARYIGNAGSWTELEQVGSSGTIDPGDPTVFADFLAWVQEQAPDKQVVLLFESHGAGWRWVGDSPIHGEITLAEWQAIASAVESRGCSPAIAVFGACNSSNIEFLCAIDGLSEIVFAPEYVTAGLGQISVGFNAEYYADKSSPREAVRGMIDGGYPSTIIATTAFAPAHLTQLLTALRAVVSVSDLQEAAKSTGDNVQSAALADLSFVIECLPPDTQDDLLALWADAIVYSNLEPGERDTDTERGGGKDSGIGVWDGADQTKYEAAVPAECRIIEGATPTPTAYPTSAPDPSGASGGGGCNTAGSGIIVLLLPLLIWKKHGN